MHKLVQALPAIPVLLSGSCGGRSVFEAPPDERRFENGPSLSAPISNESTSLDPAIHIGAAASEGFCTVHQSGKARCWGLVNDVGPGDGSEVKIGTVVPPTTVFGIEDARAVAAFVEQVCILHQSGRVSCWGWSHHSQLGETVPNYEGKTAVPLMLPHVEHVVQLASGHHHVCAVFEGGRVGCWGGPYSKSLGVPGVRETKLAVDPGLTGVSEVSASIESTCAVAAGRVYCWGDAIVGDGTGQKHDTPAPALVDDALHVAAGSQHTCALHEDGHVSCWGSWKGTTRESTYSPTRVDGLDHARQIATGYAATCALRDSGTIACWAWHGAPSGGSVDVATIHDAVEIAVSEESACAVRRSGRVACWTKDGDVHEVQWLP